MRPVLWGLLGFVVCLPLVFVLLIITAAKYPAMDTFTMKLPATVQTSMQRPPPIPTMMETQSPISSQTANI